MLRKVGTKFHDPDMLSCNNFAILTDSLHKGNSQWNIV